MMMFEPRSASWGPLSMAWWPNGFWFRIFGYGLNVNRRATHRVYFSERYGYARWYYLGPICWRTLAPREHKRVPVREASDG